MGLYRRKDNLFHREDEISIFRCTAMARRHTYLYQQVPTF